MATTYTLNYTGPQLDSAVQQTNTNTQNLSSHIADTSNPHNTTAEQVGAYVKPADGIPETDLSEEVQAKLNSGGGGAQNLLKGDVTVGDFDINDAKGSNVGYPLGIEVGKKYNITATVNGKEYTVVGDGMNMEGVTLLANASSPELFIELADFRFIGYDKASFTVGNDAPLPDDNNSLFMVMGDGYKTATIIVKSITEIEEVIADKVKNKLKITVNGTAKEYDGSEAVEVDINTGNSAENLLKGDVTVTVADGSLNNLVELGYPLGISADKSYRVVVEYNGENKDIVIKSSDWHKNETAVAGIVSIDNTVRIAVYDGMSSDLTINPDNACLGIDRGATSGSLTIIFKSIAEYTEVIADKVKNKLTITVNGEAKEYDGSEAVEVDINTEGANNLIRTTQSTTTSEVMGLSSNTANLNFALNLKIGSQYIIKYKHEGVIYEATAEAWNNSGITVIGSFDSGHGHEPINIIPDDETLGIIFIADKVDLVTEQTGNVSSLAMIYLEGATFPSTPDEFISLVEIETDIETYKIQSISISQGEKMSSVVTKITSAIEEELTAYNKTSAIVSVVFNNLMIADAVSGGSANNRAFVEIFNQTCTSRVTADTMSWATPLVYTYASDNELWGTMSSITQVQFGKANSSVIVSTGAKIGTTGPDFADLSNFVADNNTTIDLIFY